MKSRKAKEILARSYDGGHICMENAELAVDLAEQEAEKRMRAKAVETFKSQCVVRDSRCRIDCKGCAKVKQFIQKLNEE